MPSSGFKVEGLEELQRKLKTLPGKVQKKLLRSAVTAGAKPIVAAAKAGAPERTGTVKLSIGRKVVTKNGHATAVIGAKSNVQSEFKGQVEKPSRIIHLLEKGFIDRAGEHVPGKPFIEPALDQAGPAAVDAMADKLGKGIEREAQP